MLMKDAIITLPITLPPPLESSVIFSWTLFLSSSSPKKKTKRVSEWERETTYHDFLVFGACRLNGKSLICLWHVFPLPWPDILLSGPLVVYVVFFALCAERPIFIHSAMCLLFLKHKECFYCAVFPFWESYFSISPIGATAWLKWNRKVDEKSKKTVKIINISI